MYFVFRIRKLETSKTYYLIFIWKHSTDRFGKMSYWLKHKRENVCMYRVM